MQKQEEKELEQPILNNPRMQQPLQHPNQHFPSKQLGTQHQYKHFKLQLAKTRLQLSLVTVALCIAGYIGVYYWISVAIPVGPMSSYASAFGGGFPLDFGVQIGAIVFFGLLCIIMLERINPNIARRIKEDYRRT